MKKVVYPALLIVCFGLAVMLGIMVPLVPNIGLVGFSWYANILTYDIYSVITLLAPVSVGPILCNVTAEQAKKFYFTGIAVMIICNMLLWSSYSLAWVSCAVINNGEWTNNAWILGIIFTLALLICWCSLAIVITTRGNADGVVRVPIRGESKQMDVEQEVRTRAESSVSSSINAV